MDSPPPTVQSPLQSTATTGSSHNHGQFTHHKVGTILFNQFDIASRQLAQFKNERDEFFGTSAGASETDKAVSNVLVKNVDDAQGRYDNAYKTYQDHALSHDIYNQDPEGCCDFMDDLPYTADDLHSEGDPSEKGSHQEEDGDSHTATADTVVSPSEPSRPES